MSTSKEYSLHYLYPLYCIVFITTDNLKNLLSNFGIPYKDKDKYSIEIHPITGKNIKIRSITFKREKEEYTKNIKYNYIKYIDNYHINIDFIENNLNKIIDINQNKKNIPNTYFFSDSINRQFSFNDKVIILRKDLRNNIFSKLFPGSILEKQQNKIKDNKEINCGYLTFIKDNKKTNIIPPFAFTSKRKNREIIIESILLGISIRLEQEKTSRFLQSNQQVKNSLNTLNNSTKKYYNTEFTKLSKTILKPIKCMIFTHNSILRCFLHKITNDDIFLNTRFKNNVILKITVKKEESFLEMISEGNLPKSKKTQDTNKNSPEKENLIKKKPEKKYFGIKNIPDNIIFENKHLDLSNYWNILGCNLEIYIVRHGVAYHNIRNVFTKHLVYDTSLVPNQNRFSNTTKDLITDIDYYFVSPLIRTRQTFLNFIRSSFILNSNIVILPCSREIGSVKGNCSQEKIKPFENRTLSRNKDKPIEGKIHWDWSFYDREKGKCSEDSNMIYEMIKYIFYNKIHSDTFLRKYARIKDNKKKTERQINEKNEYTTTTNL